MGIVMLCMTNNQFLKLGLTYLEQELEGLDRSLEYVFIDLAAQYKSEYRQFEKDVVIFYFSENPLTRGLKEFIVRKIHKGIFLCKSMAKKEIAELILQAGSQIGDTHRPHKEIKDILTKAETSVISLLWQGLSHSSCADKLGIHIKTVSCHKRNAMKKLGVQTTQDLFIRLEKVNRLAATLSSYERIW